MGRGQGGKRGSGGYKECLVKVGWGKKQVETSRYNKKKQTKMTRQEIGNIR